MTFRIAVVQPICHRPGTDENNVADAVATVAARGRPGRAFRLLPGDLSRPVADADDVRSDRRNGRGRQAARRARRVRHARADRCEGGDRLQPDLHGLSRRPRAGALPPHASERAVDLHRRHCLGVPIRAGRRIPGVRHRARQGRARDVQRGLRAGGDARAGAARRRADLHAGRQGQEHAVGDLAHADLGARDREPGAGGDHAEPVRSLRARARDGGGAGGDHVREHGRRHDAWSTSISRACAICARRATRSDRPTTAPPSRACSARNGSGRSSTTRSIRGRCAKRRSEFSRACPLAPISVPGRSSAMRQAASSARPRSAPTPTRCARSKPTPRRAGT